MKIPKTSSKTIHAVLFIAAIVATAMVPNAQAGLTGPYPVDANTLHLWHLQETNGPLCFDCVSNQNLQVGGSMTLSNTPGPNAFSPSTDAWRGYTGESGPTNLFAYGYQYSIMTTQYACFPSPWSETGYGQVASGTAYPLVNYTNIANYVSTNTGAFTFECCIQPAVNLLTYTTDNQQGLLCGDNSGTTANPPIARGWQFRVDSGLAGGQAELEFNDIGCPGTHADLFAYIPTTVQAGQWYHVAVAYTGSAPTNGDPANVLTFYWTPFQATYTNAQILTNIYNAFTYSNSTAAGMLNWTSPTGLCTGLYPSNSLCGTPFFVVGGIGRGSMSNDVAHGNGFVGNMEEVRLSSCYRHSNEFMFNDTAVLAGPGVSDLSTNTLIGYGQTLTLQAVESGTTPIASQWYQIVNGVTNALAGQTNATLTISNVTYSANGGYQLLVTNVAGGASSVVDVVTVGATFQGLFNTGCDANNNPLAGTAPGSVDLHWQLIVNPDPVSVIPDAYIWNNGAPLQPNGILIPNGASDWIGPETNSGTVAGTYTYETTFQVDEAEVTNAMLYGTLQACGPTGNGIVQAVLNGVETNIVLGATPAEDISSFEITSGLQAGSNTLELTLVSTGSGGGANGINVNINGIGYALTNAPAINNQPSTDVVNYGGIAQFSVVALGAPPLSYQWYSNGVAVAGATSSILSFVATNFNNQEAVGGQFNANYQVAVSNFEGAVTSSPAQLTIDAGMTVVSAGQPIWNQNNNVVVLFSGTVDPVTASEAGNYTLNNATVSSVNVVAPDEVALTTSDLTPGTSYTLTVQGVEDSIGVAISPTNLVVGIYPATTELWVRADTGVTTDANGVNQWNDLSGNQNDLYQQSGPPYEPQLATNSYIGKPVIRFTGTNETYMAALPASTLAITGDMSIFAVVEFATLAGGTNGTIVSKTQSNIPAPYDYYAGSTTVNLYRGNGTIDGAVNSYKVPEIGAPHLLDVIMQGTHVTHRLDGNTNGAGVLSTTIADLGHDLYIGSREDAHNRLTGDLAELVLIGSALSTNDVASMENYLITRYSLPTGTNAFPVLIEPPVSSTNVSEGSALTLPAVATGSGPLWYQWFDVGNGTNIITGTTSGGPLNATLTVPNVPAAWNGDQLELTVTNPLGATTVYFSINVVTGAPQIVTEPQSTVVAEAGTVASNSVFALGSFPLFYQWQFNGTNLSNDSQIGSAQAAALTIADVQAANAGDYQVIVSNIYGSATSDIVDLAVIGDQPIGFNSGTGWTANQGGSAGLPTISSNLLTLTDGNDGETRSFFFNYPQYIGGFEASFTYQAGGNRAADGISFCIQNDSQGPAAVGGGGGELAVEGITPSCELEFNIYGTSGTGLGYSFDTDGTIGDNKEPGPISLGSGDPIGVSLYYAQGELSLTLTDSVAQTSFSTNLVVGSIPNIVNGSTAYVGFTGADGGANSVQTISNFTFVSIPPETIQLNSTSSLISWPGTVQGYLLQESTNLLSGNWVDVTNPATVVNGTNQVTAPATRGNMFYRLMLEP